MRQFEIRQGDCLERLREMADGSIDACATDPPYELGFMGKTWDASGIANSVELWREVLRVLKPGGHLLAFGGTRTYHRMVCAIEDAGFEIRDSIHWMYGSGFPKSLDVSKAIDKAAGMDREIVSTSKAVKRMILGADQDKTGSWIKDNGRSFVPSVTVAATDEAKQWDGWGTALKPAHEPIVLARKPLGEPTVAANVLRYGTGALNVDGCRIPSDVPVSQRGAGGLLSHVRDGKPYPNKSNQVAGVYGDFAGHYRSDSNNLGRWPANVIFDEDAAAELDAQSGHRPSSGDTAATVPSRTGKNVYGHYERVAWEAYGDEGGASRFFYVAKASTSERGDGNNHPTVKPIELMQYLCRLVTPPDGTVLDLFTGSGTTGIAALREGFRFIGIERESGYIEIAKRRILNDAPLLNRETEMPSLFDLMEAEQKDSAIA